MLGPRHYAFQHASTTFIVLDNVYYFGRSPNGTPGDYCGRIGVEQLEFVRSVLAHVPWNTLVVLSMHIPLVTYQDAASAASNTSDFRDLLCLLSNHPYSVSFSGHMHSTEHHYLALNRKLDAHHHHVLTAASGSWWCGPKDSRGIPTAESPDGNPNGFHILSIDGPNYSTRFVPAPEKASAQMRVMVEPWARDYASGSIPGSELSQCSLLVNVFDGGPRTRVTFEIAGTGIAPQPMHHVALPDPFVAGKPWVRPVPSSHVWKAPFPGGLPAGAHVVTVRARDEYGRSITTHHDLRIG